MNPVETNPQQISQQELVDIADRMLAKLEREYLEIQGQNFVMPGASVECPEEEINIEEYQVLGGDEDGPGNMSEDDEEEEEGERQAEASAQIGEQSPAAPNDQGGQGSEKDKDLQGIGQLMEVFPIEEWVAPEKQITINAQKIKQMSLGMNLPVPEWMKDDTLLRTRILQLFGPKQAK